jgi:hypothetical protein
MLLPAAVREKTEHGHQRGGAMIHYSLHKNEKIAGQDRYVARVHSHGTLSRADVIKRALQRGTTFTQSDLDGAWDLFETTAIDAPARRVERHHALRYPAEQHARHL